MNYYKVIADGNVIDANFVFLKWQHKHHILIGCDASEGEFIQSSDQEKVWRTTWLNPPPQEAGEYETVNAVEISEEEYEEIREQLDSGEEVPEPEPPDVSTEPPTEPDEPEESEPVMSAAEMRRIITEQAEKIKEQDARMEFIEDCLLEMSEVVYDG